MSYSNVLRELNSRPIAYFPIYRKITGSTTAGILLSQIMYWFSKKDKFYKTDTEIIEETQLTKNELRTAKKKLKELDFITISVEGIPAKTYYKISWKTYETSLVKLTKQLECNSLNSDSEFNETNTNTTTNTTTKNNNINNIIEEEDKVSTKNLRQSATSETYLDLYNFLQSDEAIILFEEYITLRKKMKLSNSTSVVKRLQNKLEAYRLNGYNPIEIIGNAITNNWKDFYEPKSKPISFEEQRKQTTSRMLDTVANGFDPFDPKNYENQNSSVIDTQIEKG